MSSLPLPLPLPLEIARVAGFTTPSRRASLVRVQGMLQCAAASSDVVPAAARATLDSALLAWLERAMLALRCAAAVGTSGAVVLLEGPVHPDGERADSERMHWTSGDLRAACEALGAFWQREAPSVVLLVNRGEIPVVRLAPGDLYEMCNLGAAILEHHAQGALYCSTLRVPWSDLMAHALGRCSVRSDCGATAAAMVAFPGAFADAAAGATPIAVVGAMPRPTKLHHVPCAMVAYSDMSHAVSARACAGGSLDVGVLDAGCTAVAVLGLSRGLLGLADAGAPSPTSRPQARSLLLQWTAASAISKG